MGRAGSRRGEPALLARNKPFLQRQLGSVALVSGTPRPAIVHTLTLWERNGLGQEELGEKKKKRMGRVGPVGSGVPVPPQGTQETTAPFPRSAAEGIGTWPKKALLHQEMPELHTSSAAPNLPSAAASPGHGTQRRPSWPARPPLPTATMADQQARDLALGEKEGGWVAGGGGGGGGGAGAQGAVLTYQPCHGGSKSLRVANSNYIKFSNSISGYIQEKK